METNIMETYIYTTSNKSPKRGYNKVIIVHRIKNNQPIFIGEEHVSTSSYYGDNATACKIVADNTNHKMSGSYFLKSEKVRVIELYS